jgi:hypothetical protein
MTSKPPTITRTPAGRSAPYNLRAALAANPGLVYLAARRSCRRFPAFDFEDNAGDLVVRVLTAQEPYDPARARLSTYLVLVARRLVARQRKALMCGCRDPARVVPDGDPHVGGAGGRAVLKFWVRVRPAPLPLAGVKQPTTRRPYRRPESRRRLSTPRPTNPSRDSSEQIGKRPA